ncbi:MAG: hypothetical protein CK425_10865 [Parachlamydia sp.]|nr:MAG: hypothetical protein CK425_10865 [Parachlamydia sp.]
MNIDYQTTLIMKAPGEIHRGSNPCRSAAESGTLSIRDAANLQKLKNEKFTHIVCLLEKARAKAIPFYREKDFKVVHFPIADYGTPDPFELAGLVKKISNIAQDPKNKILVHCQGGFGRTGLVLACLQRAVTGCSGNEAIAKIRKLVPHSIETKPQENLVRNFHQVAQENKRVKHIERLEAQIAALGTGKSGRAKKSNLVLQLREYAKVV